MMSQPWRCLNECPRVGLVRGRRDRAGFPGRGDAPARTRVTRLRVGKLLARSQSRQTDCPRFSRHTRWPPGTDPSPRETQTTPAPRKTLKYTDNQPAGAVPVTSGDLTTSSTHRSDTPVKPRPPQLREKPSNTPTINQQGWSRLHHRHQHPTQGRSRLHQPKHRVPQGRSRLHQPGHHTTRRGPTVSAARRQVRRPRHRLGAPRACLSRAQPGPSPGRRRARRGRGGSARRSGRGARPR